MAERSQDGMAFIEQSITDMRGMAGAVRARHGQDADFAAALDRWAGAVETLVQQHAGAVSALELIRDWELDPGDEPEYVWDELRKIAVEVVGPRPSTNRGQ